MRRENTYTLQCLIFSKGFYSLSLEPVHIKSHPVDATQFKISTWKVFVFPVTNFSFIYVYIELDILRCLEFVEGIFHL